jgi:hypothetical protein
MSYIDYQKAFDRVAHSWIIKSLEIIEIINKVIAFTKKAMTYWRTHMRLHAENDLTETEDIKKNTVGYFKKTHYHLCYFAFVLFLLLYN